MIRSIISSTPLEDNLQDNDEDGDGITPALEDLRRLAELLEEYDLQELFYEQNGLRLVLRSPEFFAPAPVAPPIVLPLVGGGSGLPAFAGGTGVAEVPPTVPDPASVNAALTAKSARPTLRIEAPVMGVFYRSSSEKEPPFVEEGDEVEENQAVGLIEAMKVFSEVLSETAGRVVSIPARNGALVQPGDTLVVLEVEG